MNEVNRRLSNICAVIMLAAIIAVSAVCNRVDCLAQGQKRQQKMKANDADELNAEKLLSEHIGTCAITFSITSEGERPGLRSLELHVTPSIREPHATWPNGQPMSADAVISASSAQLILKVLFKHGVIDRTAMYYSNRSANPRTKPLSDAVPYSQWQEDKSHPCNLRINYFDDDWHVYFVKSLGSKQMDSLLKEIEPILDNKAGKQNVISLRESLEALDHTLVKPLIFPGTPVESLHGEGNWGTMVDGGSEPGKGARYSSEHGTFGVVLLDAAVPASTKKILEALKHEALSESDLQTLQKSDNPPILRTATEQCKPTVLKTRSGNFLLCHFVRNENMRVSVGNQSQGLPAVSYEAHAFRMSGNRLVHIYLTRSTMKGPQSESDENQLEAVTRKFRDMLATAHWKHLD